MTTTPHLGLVLLEQSQSQKEVTVNEALCRLDVLTLAAVEDRDLSVPPTMPAPGAAYVVAAGAAGEWAGKEGQIAYFDQIWRFVVPQEGFCAWVKDENRRIIHDGTAWILGDATEFSNLGLLGVGATADATNRLAVRSPAVLFNAESGDIRLKANKGAVANTASYLFQTGYSGRAEFGLIGGDDFSLKVSADGASFVEALRVDRATGGLDVKQQLSASGSSFRRMMVLRPGPLRPSLVAGCADAVASASGSGLPDLYTLDFDALANESAQICLPMPRNWNEGTLSAQFLWSHGAASGSYGVVWSIAGVACGDGDAIGAGFGTAVGVSDTGGVTGRIYHSAETGPVTMSGPAAEGDLLYLRVQRLATDGADTLGVDARLHAVRLFYTQAGLGDE